MAKYSKTAEKLLPHLLQELSQVQPVIIAAASSGGAMAVHAIDGAYHSGTLAEAQAPWAVTATTFATHEGDASAHHAPVTVVAPIALSGQQVSLTYASPLTVTGGTTLDVLLADGVEDSSGIRVKLPANSGITRDSTGIYLAPSTLTVSTSNGVSGSGHTHGVTASSDVGTTPAAAILKSTAGGALTLASLTTKGSLDVLNGGDLTVAGSGSYAGSNVLFVDSSGGNVGILGAPDPQFALDIVGPARASYWIGPHAIQLKDVLLLAHYDGRMPFEANYSGEPNGHMGQVATVTGGTIYRAGKFYKSAQIAPATTNVIVNPSFETNTTGWSAILSASITRTSENAVLGSYCALVGTTGSNTGGVTIAYTTSTGGQWAASVYLKAYTGADVGDNVSLRIRFNYSDATGGDTAVNHTLTADWTRVTVSATANGAKTVTSIEVHVRDLLAQAAHQWLMDCVQLEPNFYMTPYCDGSLGGYTAGGVPDGSAHAWTGTAHASTSSRTVATLSYPITGNLLQTAGTVMAWVYVDANNSESACGIIDAGSAWPYFAIYIAGGTTPTLLIGNVSGYSTVAGPAMTVRGWYHIAATWDAATGIATMYTNGVAGTPISGFYLPTLGTGINVGALPTLGTRYLNGYIDDLCILSRAAPAGEILSVYGSNAPVFAETARFSFRATPKGLVWADDEGLWMRDSTGGPVLGAYGGEAASKSWASLTLAPGDVVLGDGASSYLLWDDSAGTLKLNTVSGADTAYMLLSGFYLDMYANAVRRFRFDADLGQVWIGQVATNSANVYITDSLLAMCVNTTEKVILSSTGGSGSSGYILVGETSSTSKNNVYIDADGMKFRQGTSITNVAISTVGVITVGEVGAGKSNIQISAGAINLRNNTDSVITLRASAAADGTIASFDGAIGLSSGGGIYQGTGTFSSPTTGLKYWYDGTATQIGVYNGGTLNASYGGGDLRFLITASSASTYNQVQFVRAIDTASIDTYYHSKLFGVYDSGNKRNTLYMRSYVNTSTDASHQSRVRLEAFAYNGSTTTGPVFELYKDNTGSYAHLQTESFYINGFLRYANQGSNYTAPADGYCQVYVKSDKIVFQYTQSGTTNYLSILLTGTGTTWTHGTTAP